MDARTAEALRQIADGLEAVMQGIRSLTDEMSPAAANDVCAAVRPGHGAGVFSCVRPVGHLGKHIDSDGDEFHA